MRLVKLSSPELSNPEALYGNATSPPHPAHPPPQLLSDIPSCL